MYLVGTCYSACHGYIIFPYGTNYLLCSNLRGVDTPYDHHSPYADLQVTSLPSVLFDPNDGPHNVVEGSVIQLYCSVESTTASFSWTKNGSPVVIDVPHLRERTSNDSNTTTSVLTVDNFQSSDTGTYECSASDGMRTGIGGNVTLSGKFCSNFH